MELFSDVGSIPTISTIDSAESITKDTLRRVILYKQSGDGGNRRRPCQASSVSDDAQVELVRRTNSRESVGATSERR